MSLKHGLLGLLNYGSMTGYDLKKTFDDSLSFFWRAKTSQIYRELNAMEKDGLLSSEHVIQTDKPNKRLYQITDAGQAELRRWLANPEDDIAAAMQPKSAFLMRVFFAGETSKQDQLALLRAYREQCVQAGNSMDVAYRSINEYGETVNDQEKSKHWGLTALYGTIFYQAGADWASKAIALLEENEEDEEE